MNKARLDLKDQVGSCSSEDPTIERIVTPRLALTTAEYFAHPGPARKKVRAFGFHVLWGSFGEGVYKHTKITKIAVANFARHRGRNEEDKRCLADCFCERHAPPGFVPHSGYVTFCQPRFLPYAALRPTKRINAMSLVMSPKLLKVYAKPEALQTINPTF